LQISTILREFIVHADCSKIVAMGALMSRLDPMHTNGTRRKDASYSVEFSWCRRFLTTISLNLSRRRFHSYRCRWPLDILFIIFHYKAVHWSQQR